MNQQLSYFFYTIRYEIPYITREWIRNITRSEKSDHFWYALNFGWWQMQISDDY